MKNDEQLKVLKNATDKALKIVEKERLGKQRHYLNEWFRWVELVAQYIKKRIN
jgi:hypothetical protein